MLFKPFCETEWLFFITDLSGFSDFTEGGIKTVIVAHGVR